MNFSEYFNDCNTLKILFVSVWVLVTTRVNFSLVKQLCPVIMHQLVAFETWLDMIEHEERALGRREAAFHCTSSNTNGACALLITLIVTMPIVSQCWKLSASLSLLAPVCVDEADSVRATPWNFLRSAAQQPDLALPFRADWHLRIIPSYL